MKYTRKHPRKPVRLRVHCSGDGIYFSDTTVNLSEGGVGLETVSRIEPGDTLRVEFVGQNGKRLEVETEVVWVKPAIHNDAERYATGLQFKTLSQEQRANITYHLQATPPRQERPQ